MSEQQEQSIYEAAATAKKRLKLAIIIASAASGVAIWLGLSVSAARIQANQSEEQATKWKRQAGKAYTELLKARAGGPNADLKILIPKGTRLECVQPLDAQLGKVIGCREFTIYPPSNY